jgi:hypothetical protein
MVFSHGLKTHGIFPWYFEKWTKKWGINYLNNYGCHVILNKHDSSCSFMKKYKRRRVMWENVCGWKCNILTNNIWRSGRSGDWISFEEWQLNFIQGVTIKYQWWSDLVF